METVCTRSLTVCARLSIFSAPSLSDGLDGERLERAFSLSQNARHVAGQIDHRARLDAAGPGIESVADSIGSFSSASSACATGCPGTLTPIVFLRGCIERRGTWRLARRM